MAVATKKKTTKKVLTFEKRNTIVYTRVKGSNRRWLEQQAKKHDLKLSPTLDMFLDKLRKQYPLRTTSKAA